MRVLTYIFLLCIVGCASVPETPKATPTYYAGLKTIKFAAYPQAVIEMNNVFACVTPGVIEVEENIWGSWYGKGSFEHTTFTATFADGTTQTKIFPCSSAIPSIVFFYNP